MATVYILYSTQADRYYIGSSKDFARRYEFHLLKEFPQSYTARHDDWELFFRIDNLDISVARKIEAHIKRMKSKVYIQNLVKYPDMLEKLIVRYT
jgi:putative endonuclease